MNRLNTEAAHFPDALFEHANSLTNGLVDIGNAFVRIHLALPVMQVSLDPDSEKLAAVEGLIELFEKNCFAPIPFETNGEYFRRHPEAVIKHFGIRDEPRKNSAAEDKKALGVMTFHLAVRECGKHLPDHERHIVHQWLLLRVIACMTDCVSRSTMKPRASSSLGTFATQFAGYHGHPHVHSGVVRVKTAVAGIKTALHNINTYWTRHDTLRHKDQTHQFFLAAETAFEQFYQTLNTRPANFRRPDAPRPDGQRALRTHKA